MNEGFWVDFGHGYFFSQFPTQKKSEIISAKIWVDGWTWGRSIRMFTELLTFSLNSHFWRGNFFDTLHNRSFVFIKNVKK